MPKAYEFGDLDSVLDALNQGRKVDASDVRPSVLRSWIYVGYAGMGGGYMPDPDSHFYARNLRAIVDSHCESARMEDEADRVPPGFRRSLMQGGSAESRGGTVYESDRITVRDAIG